MTVTFLVHGTNNNAPSGSNCLFHGILGNYFFSKGVQTFQEGFRVQILFPMDSFNSCDFPQVGVVSPIDLPMDYLK